MSNISTHDNIVLLNHCDATLSIIAIFLVLHIAPLMVLLSLNNMSSKHLRILYLDLRVVENVIVVIDVLNDPDRLLPTALLLRL